MIARQEEFYRVEPLEEFFEATVIEVLSRFALAPRAQRQHLRIEDAIGIQRHGVRLLLGVEEGEERGLRPEYMIEPVDSVLQKRGRQELKSIPDQGSVEA